MDTTAVTNALATLPPGIAHTMVSASVIAGTIHAVIAFLKTPLAGEIWTTMAPRVAWWVKPAVLLGLTTASGVVDAIAGGQPWYLALGAALTGLGGAVVSHEWKALFVAAQADKAATKRAAAAGTVVPPLPKA